MLMPDPSPGSTTDRAFGSGPACVDNQQLAVPQSRIDAERAAAAREIHDAVGGALTALRFDLQWIRRHGGAAVQSRTDEALAALDEALAATGRVVRSLHPPVLDAGIVAALQWHVVQQSGRGVPSARFACNRDRIDLSAEVALTVFRVAQEALTNVAKHAQATEAIVDLLECDGVLSLEISDDGRGFAPGDLAKPQAFGLRGLAERARTAGGWLDVSSANGRTTVLLTLPVTPQAAPRVAEDARAVRTGARQLREAPHQSSAAQESGPRSDDPRR